MGSADFAGDTIQIWRSYLQRTPALWAAMNGGTPNMFALREPCRICISQQLWAKFLTTRHTSEIWCGQGSAVVPAVTVLRGAVRL